MGKGIAILLLVVVIAPSFAQTRAAQGKGIPRVGPSAKARFNSTAKDTTPFQCEALHDHIYPGMKSLCDRIESDHIQSEARRVGRPGPSSSVIDLPSLGSVEGKRLGVVCMGGQAMRKISNGWEQVWGRDGWQRCRGG